MTAFDDDNLHVDFAQREVTLDGQPVRLNRKEYLLLATLVRRQGQPVSVSELVTLIWGDDTPSGAASTALRMYVFHLRRKLTGHGPEDYSAIETIAGFGYRYRSQP